jgi:hypothetical protein
MCGVVRCYEQVLDITGSRYLVKMDSDTVMLSAGGLRAAAADGVAAAGACSVERGFYGAAELIGADVVKKLADLSRGGVGRPELGVWHEDLVTYAAAVEVGVVRKWMVGQPKGFFTGWQYGNELRRIEDLWRWEVVTFGNRFLISGGSREVVAAEMWRCFDSAKQLV